MKYFNSIKNISHIIGFGYYDRSVEKQEVGEANIVTKKKKTRNAVVDETRKIKFRDDSMIADAKSRFADIIGEIPLDTDEFIKAIQDAINNASGKSEDVKPPKKTTKKSTPIVEEEDDLTAMLRAVVDKAKVKDEVAEDDVAPFDIDEDLDIFNEEEVEDADPIITLDDDRLNAIRAAFKAGGTTTKATVKKHLANYGGKLTAEMHRSDVDAIESVLGLSDEV
jgi:hypothetical protein